MGKKEDTIGDVDRGRRAYQVSKYDVLYRTKSVIGMQRKGEGKTRPRIDWFIALVTFVGEKRIHKGNPEMRFRCREALIGVDAGVDLV